MQDTIPESQLEKLAVGFGMKPSYVRRCVDQKFLAPAISRRDRLGCLQWGHPAANLCRLRAVLTLRAFGYRGNGLHFVLWWFGLHPFPSWAEAGVVPCFVGYVADDIYTLCQKQFIQRAGAQVTLRAITINSLDGEVCADPKAARTIIADIPARAFVEATLGRLPQFSNAFDSKARDSLVKVFHAIFVSILGVRPTDLGYSPTYELGSIRNSIRRIEADDRKEGIELVSTIIPSLDTADSFEQARRWLNSTKPDTWRRARQAVLSDWAGRALRKSFTVGIAHGIRDGSIKVNPRLLRNHFILRHPTLAMCCLQLACQCLLLHWKEHQQR